jgi:hypothetical protein
MEHHKAMTSDLTTINSNNNNNSHHHHHHHNRRKRRTSKQQPLVSLSSAKKPPVKSASNTNQENIPLSDQQHQQIPMKNPLSWRKRCFQWFSSCGSDRTIYVKSNPITISIQVR